MISISECLHFTDDHFIADLCSNSYLFATFMIIINGAKCYKVFLFLLGIRPVTFEEWKKIDEYEIKQGKKVGKPREKIVDIKDFLEIAHS